MKSISKWYAIEVTYRKEKAVAEALYRKGFECYLPLYESRRAWSDRIKVMSVPLFGGYLFCRLEPESRRMPILMTPGVRQFVGLSGEPEPIPDIEIESIRLALESGVPLEPCDRLETGNRVLVKCGAFEGVEGSFVRYQGKDRLILTVSLIQRSVAVEIDRAWVESVSETRLHDRAFGPTKRIVGNVVN